MSEFLHNPDAGGARQLPAATGIRQARLNKGLSLETLASVLKVTPAKLEALESGRYDELPDLAFARALAKTVCRYLGLDPATVLSTFPSIQPVDLSSSDHKGVPFKDSKARLNLDVASSMPFKLELKAQWLVPMGILLAALAVYLVPAQNSWFQGLSERLASWSTKVASPEEAPQVAASSAAPALPPELVQQNASAAEVASSEVQEPVLASAPMASASDLSPARQAASAGASSPAVGGAAVLGASASSPVAAAPMASTISAPVALLAAEPAWVEVKDASGAKVLSRQLLAGESASVGGQAPFSVKIGNAAAVKLSYQGQAVELAAFSRSNVARLELK